MTGRGGRLRFSTIAAPLLPWAVHFVAVYSLQGLVCARGWSQLAGQAGMAGLTAAAMGLVAWMAIRARRQMRGATAPDAVFAARVALYVCGLSFVAVLFTATPLWMLAPCR